MNIAFYSDNFFPEISGISDSIIITGRELIKRGHNVLYVAPQYPLISKNSVADNNLNADLLIKRLPSVSYPYSPTGQSRFAIPIGASIPFLRKFKPDIIHAHMPFGAGFEALLASRILKIPLIGTNHTPIEEFVEYIPFIGIASANIARRFFSWYYNRCEYMTAPYAGIIEDMRKMGFKRPAEALSNPILIDKFKKPTLKQKTTIKKKYNLNGPTIFYAGRLAKEKHIDVIIKSIKRITPYFPDITLLITGNGIIQSELEKLVKNLGLENNVRFSGFVSMERLAEFYQAADIFAIMSTAETQSLALMQAFSSGLPAVGANARALPYYIPKNCGFIVEPGDDKALAEKLKQLLEDKELREQMGKNGVKFVEQFSPEKIADKWEIIYKKYGNKSR